MPNNELVEALRAARRPASPPKCNHPAAAAFDGRHGDSVCINGLLVFADGASRDMNPESFYKEPPGNPFERAKIIVQYWDAKLTYAAAEFRALRQQLEMRANSAMRPNTYDTAPGPHELEPLRELQKKVKAAQKSYNRAVGEMEKLKPEDARRRESAGAGAAKQATEFISELNKIRV